MSLSTIEVVGGINEVVNLVQWVKSAFSYLWSQLSGTQEQQIQEHEVRQLESDLICLLNTLPAMYNLIDRAEWRSHEKCVAELLPKLIDAVYDAEDLQDEFRWYGINVSIEGNATQLPPLIEFFHSVTQGSFNKVNDIQKRLSNLSSQLEKMGLHEQTPRFDKSVRPVTTSFCTEPKIFGRDNEIKEVVRLLGVPNYSGRSSSKRKRTSNAANNEPRTAFLPVLPIVGMGGVGKTTLAQEITTLQSVKSHFDKIIWICVSDDFDIERFSKVLIKSLSGEEATTNNFDDLQQDLVAVVGEKRFLLILDDIWPDALKEDGLCWRKFCAPLRNVLQGSMLLVTTRFAEVADTVGTMKFFELKGLKPEVFWQFFKLCVFGSEDSHIDPELELIGTSILPKLKGSPLAAKTIGRLLRKSLITEHWNEILNSELWQLRQKETDILPALRLSYMYLPFHLKRCFSFCAVYPKDYNFQKDSLAEIWVAEGFVERQGDMSLQRIGELYFKELVDLSFFQEHRDTYVIHDLMHDMAQLVSKDECFIVKNAGDYEKVPQNVRHLSILTYSGGVKSSNLLSLLKHTKLRTLLCRKSLRNKALGSLINQWFSKFRCLRVISLASTRELPESISNLKHLRYLEISANCPLNSLPSSFCWLYNLQIFYARNCMFESLPCGFGKMINLQKFETRLPHLMSIDAVGKEMTLINKFNKITKDLIIYNIDAISKDHAAEMELWMMENLDSLTLTWSPGSSAKQNAIEVMQALHPSTNIRSFHLKCYPGEYFPSWFQSTLTTHGFHSYDRQGNQNEQPAGSGDLRCLEELIVSDCPNITSQGLFSSSLKKLQLENSGNLGDNIECCSLTYLHLSCSNITSIQLEKWRLPALQELVIAGCDSVTSIGGKVGSIFSSLTELRIDGCKNLSSVEQFIQPAYVPAIKKIVVKSCQRLVSLLTARSGDLCCLEEVLVSDCPNIISQGLFASSLKKLQLENSGNLGDNIECCSLTYLRLSCSNLTSIQLEKWRLPSLQELVIAGCDSVTSIGGRVGSIFSSLTELRIDGCKKLSSVEQFIQPACVPAIKKIVVKSCLRLVSLLTARSGDLRCLEELIVSDCPNITSQGLFSSSLKKLQLENSGNLGDNIECCSLTYLHLSCSNITSIQLEKWMLPALQKVAIIRCNSLTFIGACDISHHRARSSIGTFSSLIVLDIQNCSKLQNVDDLLSHECIPAVEKIRIICCEELQFLHGERFQSLPFLRDLEIGSCPLLKWQSGMVLASSLQRLILWHCGDFSAWFPRCLENLVSLLFLEFSCERVEWVPGNLWSNRLVSLRELRIWNCPDLVSIGGPNAIANIGKVFIADCKKLKEVHQPFMKP